MHLFGSEPPSSVMAAWLVVLFLSLPHFTGAADTTVFVPAAGPASGGTILTASLLPEPCRTATAVLFGGAGMASAALHRSKNVSGWSCTVPSALDTGAASIFNWSSILDSASLRGAASRTDDDIVELTSVRNFGSSGALVVALPMPWRTPGAAAVRVSFELLVGRGTGGEGLSVSFGHVSAASFADERGVAGGLAVSFSTVDERFRVLFRDEVLLERRLDGRHGTVQTQRALLTATLPCLPADTGPVHFALPPQSCDMYNCERCEAGACELAGCEWIHWLQRCEPPLLQQQLPSPSAQRHAVRSARFVPVHVIVADETVTVLHDGLAFAERVPIPGWVYTAMSSTWQLVFGARTSLRVDDHWIRDVQVVQGGLAGDAPSTLSVLNGADGCYINATFRYYASPVLSRASLHQGPVHGGTPVRVYGEHLSRGLRSQLACRFGNTTVPASQHSHDALDCTTPNVGAAGPVAIAVSLNGFDFTGVAGAPTFTFTDAQVTAIRPDRTAALGVGTLITLTGAGLGGGSKYLCRFDAIGTTAAYLDAARSSVICMTPSGHIGDASSRIVDVGLSLNGHDFTSSNINFTYYAAPRLGSLSPSTGPTAGSTAVLVRGEFGNVSGWVRCSVLSCAPPHCRSCTPSGHTARLRAAPCR